MNRFNRYIGILNVAEQKYILYTNYTYIILDTSKKVSGVDIISDHPGKQSDKDNWFSNLKKSQTKFLKDTPPSILDRIQNEAVSHSS